MFIFEIPTGVLADVKSWRLSVIIGYVLIGLGFIIEGSFPFLWTVALAQVVWGFGYTFTSGATQAWIADEVGPERAGETFLRGSQAGRVGGLLAIPISVPLGSVVTALPIVVGGALMILLAGFGMARTFWLALGLYWLVGVLRGVRWPLHSAWFSQRIDDSQVRATMFSVGSQLDAIGQIAGGPVVGAIGNASIRAALDAPALILPPALPLYALAVRRGATSASPRPAQGDG